MNVDKSIRALKWLASKVPPRVHNANVRLQLNAFHTARRYQHESRCLFCNHVHSEDSLEHILVCKEIQTVFPQHLKEGSPPRLPLGYWFLQRGPPSTQILMGCIVFALYQLHNSFRHGGPKGVLKDQLFKLLVDIRFTKPPKGFWQELLLWTGFPYQHGNIMRT